MRIEELDGASVCAKIARTAADGKTYRTQYYNLDAIIAVGYRVNSRQATQSSSFPRSAWECIRGRSSVPNHARAPQAKYATLERRTRHSHAERGNEGDEHLSAKRTDFDGNCSEIPNSSKRRYQRSAAQSGLLQPGCRHPSSFPRSAWECIRGRSGVTNPARAHKPNTRRWSVVPGIPTRSVGTRGKLHWAIHGHTAAELIHGRADGSKPQMGLKTWKAAPRGKASRAMSPSPRTTSSSRSWTN